jgi:TonB family protein
MSDLVRDSRSLNEVLDSAALSRELEGLWTPSAGLTLATVIYDSVGVLDSTRIEARSATADIRSRWGATVTRHAAATGDPRQGVYVVLGDEAGPALRRVPEFRVCAPAMEDFNALRRELRRQAPSPFPPGGGTVQVMVHVDERGQVDEVRIQEGSMNAEVDSAAARAMRTASFSPAQVEGLPFDVWVTLPVTFQGSPQATLLNCGNYTPAPRGQPDVQVRQVRALVGADGLVSAVQPIGALDGYAAQAMEIARTCVFEPARGDPRNYPIRRELVFYLPR